MEETLKQILNAINGVKSDVTGIKQDVASLKEDVSVLKGDVSGLKSDVAGLKSDVAELKEDVAGLKKGQVRIEKKVDLLSSELSSNFKYTNNKLDEHRKVFNVVPDEIKSMKVDVDYLSAKTGKHDTDLNNIINKLRG